MASEKTRPSPGPRDVVLILSGGSALGAFHAGVAETVLTGPYRLQAVAGTSIGAVQAGLLAGNREGVRLDALRAFWARVTTADGFLAATERWWRSMGAGMAGRGFGNPGLFRHHFPGALAVVPVAPEDTGLYDLDPLRRTLSDLVDFDLLNSAALPVVLNLVDVVSGAEVHFDSRRQRLGVEHFTAACAFPPDFVPVEADGRLYWDGSLACNIPRPPRTDSESEQPVLVVADAFSCADAPPTTLDDAMRRPRELMLAHQVDRRVAELTQDGNERRDILHLVYRRPQGDSSQRTLDFSATSIGERWAAGAAVARTALDELAACPERYSRRWEV